jgi:hypothetical protein
MNKHKVSFSMTTFFKEKIKEEKIRYILINMRADENWFFTQYVEINGKCWRWEDYITFYRFNNYIKHYLSKKDDD